MMFGNDRDMEYGHMNRPVMSAGETILWSGKPKKSSFIMDRSLTMLPIAIVWICFDGAAIANIFRDVRGQWFLIPFFAFHLLPVWIWLGNVITASRRWKNTTYYVTNRRIIIQGGFLAVNEESLFFKEVRNVRVRIGLLDKLMGTGDVCFNEEIVNKKQTGSFFEDIENPHDVYALVQKIVLDMQTDMEYPNAFRPAENPGYNTEYKP